MQSLNLQELLDNDSNVNDIIIEYYRLKSEKQKEDELENRTSSLIASTKKMKKHV